jgi:hypothetical protein
MNESIKLAYIQGALLAFEQAGMSKEAAVKVLPALQGAWNAVKGKVVPAASKSKAKLKEMLSLDRAPSSPRYVGKIPNYVMDHPLAAAGLAAGIGTGIGAGAQALWQNRTKKEAGVLPSAAALRAAKDKVMGTLGDTFSNKLRWRGEFNSPYATLRTGKIPQAMQMNPYKTLGLSGLAGINAGVGVAGLSGGGSDDDDLADALE